jgi:hypothetical protein
MEENKTSTAASSGSLHDMLKQETEHKQESTTSSFWKFDEKEEEKPASAEQQEEGEKQLSNKKKEDNQKASAETLTSLFDAGFDILLGFQIDYRFRNNFTDEQWEKVQDIQDVPKEKLEGEALELRNRYDRLLAKRDKKKKNLPFDDGETNRLNRIFFNYYKVTNKELSPEVLLYMGITSAVIEKARAVLLD